MNLSKLRKLSIGLSKLTPEVQKREARRIVRKYSRVIISLNTGQLLAGKNAKGQYLKDYNIEWYKEYKERLNPLANGHPDLKLHGNFQGSFFIADELPLIIWSYDEKTDDLVRKYGKSIFGLNEQNEKIFIYKYFKRDLVAFYRKTLHL